MGDVSKLDAVLARASATVQTLARSDEQRETQESERRTTRFRLLAASGCRVPDAVRRAVVWGELGNTAARIALRQWFDTGAVRQPWIVLAGNSGCGKTVAVADLAAETHMRFMRCEELVRVFAGLFGDSLEAQQRVIDCKLLALDDIGAELDQTRMASTLLELLDSRCSAMETPTIVTTNLNKTQWVERYGDFRITSRMRNVLWVPLAAEPDRRKGAK